MPLQTRSLRRLPIVLGTCALLACALTAQAADREAMLSAAVRIRYERYQDGAVITGHGTAFGADLSAWGFPGRRYLLSAAHNVLNDEGRPFTTLKIEVVDGPRTYWLGARTLVFDENLDLCILEAGDDLPVLGRLAVKDLRGGERAILAGSPRGTPVALYEGLMREPFYRGSVRSAVSVAFDHGCSGGPLYGAESGEVVGVAVAGIPKDGDMDHQLGLFVPVVGLRSFLEAHRRGPAVSSPEPVLAATRVVRPEPRVLPVEEPAPAPVVREETPSRPPTGRRN
ncbi:MAG: serine protease [Planctomycetota bacterium]|nr:serine protease [Planctomycetota bacterium]